MIGTFVEAQQQIAFVSGANSLVQHYQPTATPPLNSSAKHLLLAASESCTMVERLARR
jgi:hypothetical protein